VADTIRESDLVVRGIMAPRDDGGHEQAGGFASQWSQPSMARVKIVGNMMELNSPISNMVHHGDVTEGEHRRSDQQRINNRVESPRGCGAVHSLQQA